MTWRDIRPWSSIVFQVAAATLIILVMVFWGVIAAMQTPIANSLFPPALLENGASIAELVTAIEDTSERQSERILSLYSNSRRAAAISSGPGPRPGSHPEFASALIAASAPQTRVLEGRDIGFQVLDGFSLRQQLADFQAVEMRAATALQVAVPLQDGSILNVWLAPVLSIERPSAARVGLGLAVVTFVLTLSAALAAVILRPIRRLERDAEEIALGGRGAEVSETGPVELRRIAAAVNRMRARLSSLVQEREEIIASIAHDIRTGLTRIRLRLDDREQITRSEIESDMVQMEALIADMLIYARAGSPHTPRELIDLHDLVRKVVAAAPYRVTFAVNSGASFRIIGDPVALRRLFDNLLENADRYGRSPVIVTIGGGSEGIHITIEDDGPGMPDHLLERAFQPFSRGEGSRSRSTGGAGLGLGIARAVAEAHGASLTLRNRPSGGLAATIHVPGDLAL